jgi:hypothetical protein
MYQNILFFILVEYLYTYIHIYVHIYNDIYILYIYIYIYIYIAAVYSFPINNFYRPPEDDNQYIYTFILI